MTGIMQKAYQKAERRKQMAENRRLAALAGTLHRWASELFDAVGEDETLKKLAEDALWSTAALSVALNKKPKDRK